MQWISVFLMMTYVTSLTESNTDRSKKYHINKAIQNNAFHEIRRPNLNETFWRRPAETHKGDQLLKSLDTTRPERRKQTWMLRKDSTKKDDNNYNIISTNRRYSADNSTETKLTKHSSGIYFRTGLSSVSDAKCRQLGETLICDLLPATIPPNVSCVHVTSEIEKEITSDIFKDKSWRPVRRLQMSLQVRWLYDDCFSNLQNLEFLSMNCHYLTHANHTAWKGLQALVELKLTGLNQLVVDSLDNALNKDYALPRLQDLTVNPYTNDSLERFTISDTFAASLLLRPLKCFNASNVYLTISKGKAIRLCLKVDHVNLTSSILHTFKHTEREQNLNLQSSVYLMDKDSYLLKTLDVSGLKVTRSSEVFTENKANITGLHLTSEKCHQDGSLIGKIEHIYANNFKKINSWLAHNVTCTGFPWKTKSLFMRSNNLTVLNISINLDANNTLETIDLSENSMKYLSPNVLLFLHNLKHLYLSHNNLHFMEHTPEFSMLFQSQANLQTLTMDNNHLTFIPFGMFHSNKNIKQLILRWNSLASVTFDLQNLSKLQTLDLQHNKILYFDNLQVQRMDSFTQMRISKNTSMVEVMIFLQYNPLECRCTSSPFIDWYIRYTSAVQNPSLLHTTCTLAGSTTDINAQALKKSRLQCYRNTIIACSTTLTITVLMSAAAGFAIYKWAKRRKLRNDWVESFKARFRRGRLEQNFLVFAAMSSYDEDFITNNILPQLQESLHKHIRTESPLICTGMDFQPGFPIVIEAQRLIKESCVLVAMVSKAFCQSNYCKMEVMEACNQQKPVIMVLLETVEEECMSPYQLEIFRRNTRAKVIHGEEGEFIVKPSIDVLAECIVHLAADSAGSIHT